MAANHHLQLTGAAFRVCRVQGVTSGPDNWTEWFGRGGRGMFYESSRYVVTALLLLATSASGPAAPRLKDKGPTVPRDFNGKFGFYTVVLKIDSAQEKDGLIRFSGTHFYAPGDYTMKVEGTIDRKTRRVS